MTKFFRKLDALVALAEDVGCVATYAVIVCIVVAHVFFRYVLVSGILWSDELVQILLVYMVMFGSARAIRTNGHTELNSLGDKLPAMPRYVLRTAIVIACIGFFLLFFIGAAEYVANAGCRKPVRGGGEHIGIRLFRLCINLGRKPV